MIRIETGSYNERRYSKPWIAKVDFAENKKGEFKWGDWIGSAGGEGILELEANPGDIVAQGQKDFRKSANSAPTFYVVKPNNELDCLGDKGSAYKHFLADPEKEEKTGRRVKMIPEQDFDRLLLVKMNETSGLDLLGIPGVRVIVERHFRPEVTEMWKAELELEESNER